MVVVAVAEVTEMGQLRGVMVFLVLITAALVTCSMVVDQVRLAADLVLDVTNLTPTIGLSNIEKIVTMVSAALVEEHSIRKDSTLPSSVAALPSNQLVTGLLYGLTHSLQPTNHQPKTNARHLIVTLGQAIAAVRHRVTTNKSQMRGATTQIQITSKVP